MPKPTAYEPTYVDVTDVPIEVEDRYSTDQKREALYQAETDLEIDRNAGYGIPSEDITKTHKKAVLNLATYYLVRSATSNADVTLGDLDDGGEQTKRHAEQYKETYLDCLDQLAEAGAEGQPGTYMGAQGDAGGPQTVNTGRAGRRHDYRPRTDGSLINDRYVSDDT